jgi:hypothetical protein
MCVFVHVLWCFPLMGALHLISKLRFVYENATQSGSFLKGIVICADLPPILEKHSQLRRREREREREVLKGRERERHNPPPVFICQRAKTSTKWGELQQQQIYYMHTLEIRWQGAKSFHRMREEENCNKRTTTTNSISALEISWQTYQIKLHKRCRTNQAWLPYQAP